MLACNQFATTFLAHCSGTQRAVGFVSGHLGKKAFGERKNVLKFCKVQKKMNQKMNASLRQRREKGH
jgi:hypothetical protein